MPQLTLWPGEAPDPAPFRVVLRDSPDWYSEDVALALTEFCGLPHCRGVPVAATALAERIDAEGSAAVFAGSYAECRRVADALARVLPYGDTTPLVAEVVGWLDAPDVPPVPRSEPPAAAGETGDPFGRTAYRVAQHWRFRCDTPEASDTLVITSVEDHPELGIICHVEHKFEPPLKVGLSQMSSGGAWLAQGDLDRSVLGLLNPRGPLPSGGGLVGDFHWGPGDPIWGRFPGRIGVGRTLDELIRESIESMRAMQAGWDALPPPPRPGLWSMIVGDEAARTSRSAPLARVGPARAR